MSCCCGPHCTATAAHFGRAIAEADLKRYRLKGLDKRGRLLLEGLTSVGIHNVSVLDIGAGVGSMSLELLKRGAASAVLADAAPAYLEAAQAEATRIQVADRVRVEQGNFVETSGGIDVVDIVVLDRVVCCYPHWKSLLQNAASRCRRALGITYPRSRPDVRLMIGFENFRRRVKNDDFRAFVHRPRDLHEVLRAAGLERVSRGRTFAWHVDVYARASAAPS